MHVCCTNRGLYVYLKNHKPENYKVPFLFAGSNIDNFLAEKSTLSGTVV